jgi:hypothetical protein
LQFVGTQFFVILLVCCGRILRGVFVWGRRKLIFCILHFCSCVVGCRFLSIYFLFLGFFCFLVHLAVTLGCCGGFHLWFLF